MLGFKRQVWVLILFSMDF